jgi:PiT family inorganic phosphate transporter
MVFALLISAIIWNIGTWYLALPASSSHTLIGSIIGVGLANALLNGHSFSDGVNWSQVQNVFLALLISPLVGFCGSALMLLATKALVKRADLYESPVPGARPPTWIRALLIVTCSGVSFSHGSNDGQKGMGLIMLIAIGILPAAFALNMETSSKDIASIVTNSQRISAIMEKHSQGATIKEAFANQELCLFLDASGKADANTYAALSIKMKHISGALVNVQRFSQLPASERISIRCDAYLVGESISKLDKHKDLKGSDDKKAIAYEKENLEKVTKYIPWWVKIAVALALGLGTMIGWKRIVVTVGERIGNRRMTYAQGASAGLVTMLTIGAASSFGLPASTTHVLSSGIAGTMVANNSGLRIQTLRNIVLAWVLTLPVCILLGATIFSGALYLILHIFNNH